MESRRTRHPRDNTPHPASSPSRTEESPCRHAASTRSYIERCLQLVSHAGLRVTAPRRAVVSFLAHSGQPVTIAQLHDALGDCDPQSEPLSKVSLYRVIADLERIHLLHKVHPSGGYLLCAHVGCPDHSHVIISCESCAQTSEATVPGEYLGPLIFYLKSSGAHLSDPPVLRVEGLCRQCRHHDEEVVK